MFRFRIVFGRKLFRYLVLLASTDQGCPDAWERVYIVPFIGLFSRLL